MSDSREQFSSLLFSLLLQAGAILQLFFVVLHLKCYLIACVFQADAQPYHYLSVAPRRANAGDRSDLSPYHAGRCIAFADCFRSFRISCECSAGIRSDDCTIAAKWYRISADSCNSRWPSGLRRMRQGLRKTASVQWSLWERWFCTG